MFAFACGCIDIDGDIANALPFLFYWGILFYGWALFGGLISQVRAWTQGGDQPIRPLLYLLCAFGLMLPTTSLLAPLFLLGPFFLYSFGRVLRSTDPQHHFYRQVTRAVVYAGLALVPLSYLRGVAQTNGLFTDGSRYVAPEVIGATILLILTAFFFAMGWLNARTENTQRRRRIIPVTRSPRKVTLQPQQGCPLCWDVLSADDPSDLAVCRDCHTVSHLSCVVEMGGCSTLGCSRGRRGRRRPRPRGGAATTASTLGIQVRARAGQAVVAPAIA